MPWTVSRFSFQPMTPPSDFTEYSLTFRAGANQWNHLLWWLFRSNPCRLSALHCTRAKKGLFNLKVKNWRQFYHSPKILYQFELMDISWCLKAWCTIILKTTEMKLYVKEHVFAALLTGRTVRRADILLLWLIVAPVDNAPSKTEKRFQTNRQWQISLAMPGYL